MELLKVFVGDGANTGTTVATMVKGDLLLLNASNYAPWSSGDAVIAACNDNGVYFSTIKYRVFLYITQIIPLLKLTY
jgi:hypothetical protein